MGKINNAITLEDGTIIPYRAVIAIEHEQDDFRYKVWIGTDFGGICSEEEGKDYINALNMGNRGTI